MTATLGILGGMGPLATVDFMAKLIRLTPAKRDQDHVPVLVYSVPQVPDRTAAILKGNDEPLAWMRWGAETLRDAGAKCIAIPCNTAHHWHGALGDGLGIPVLHIVDAAADALKAHGIASGPIGLLGTTGTITAGVYQKRLEKLGYAPITTDDDVQERLVMGGIAEIKAGDLDAGREKLEAAAETVRKKGAPAIVLGCTEIPIVLSGPGYIDATEALARAALAWHLGASAKPRAAE
jgi:aspartate racemase